MDDNAGDGADSAEDSESSYPCPSLICGIPKARIFYQISFFFKKN